MKQKEAISSIFDGLDNNEKNGMMEQLLKFRLSC